MNYALLTIAGFQMIGIAVRTEIRTYQHDIPLLWKKFMEEKVMEKIPNKLDHDVVGLYTDYEGDYSKPYTLIVGCKVSSLDEIPQGMVSKAVPAAKYAVYAAKGAMPRAVVDTWGVIWKAPLKRAYTADFELYSSKAFDPVMPEAEIYIALK